VSEAERKVKMIRKNLEAA
jgi:hypothetical protein